MSRSDDQDLLKVALAQMAPFWLDRVRTLEKVEDNIRSAASSGCHLVVFSEGLVPGYPFWLERTDAADFDSPVQKEIFSHYLDQAVQIGAGHLDAICKLAAEKHIAVYLGIIERPLDRGGHSLYASLVYIDPGGEIGSVHRKLMPTYEERLVWSPGDGHGIRTHRLRNFTLGGLNCWENWLPLARAALYAMGEDLHVAVWPGNVRNTEGLTRFLAREGRSFVLSVSGLMKHDLIPDGFPHRSAIQKHGDGVFANGGSCIAGPDGSWVLEPVADKEELLLASLDHARVREERQNFDPAGHYARADVLQVRLNQARQSSLEYSDK